MKLEKWKVIEEFDGMYQVSNFGRVKSCKFEKERILKPGVVGRGYLMVVLCKDGKSKSMLIHRLVANAFISNPDKLPMVNHKDENKQNNHVDNLEWCNNKYNIEYSCAKQVGQYSKDGKLIKIWPSIKEAVRSGFNQGHICSCCKGKRYKSHAGYIWRYIEN